jgi:thiol-disulfide isomerase/thioredoxin
MTTKKILLVICMVVAIVIGRYLYKSYRTVPPLPAYEHDLTDELGKQVKLADFKGQYVLISYFQTWCGDCIKELPTIDALQQIVGKEKLKVMMVNDEGEAKMNHFKEKYYNTLDYYQSNKSFSDLGIHVFPTTYLLNTDGVIILSKLEGFDWASKEVVALIQ